jgi:molybdopterin-guanine dinucleotide biosynthesis protein A
MGTDKGLMSVSAQTWAEAAAGKMGSLGIPVVLSVNTRQLAEYSRVFSADRLVADDMALSLSGPLAGLVSVHVRVPAEDLFVLACDLLSMDTALLEALYLRRRERDDAHAYLYAADGEPEPLCGIYTRSGLALISGLYQADRLVKYSMKYALSQLCVDSLPILDDQRRCFENFNYPPEVGGTHAS